MAGINMPSANKKGPWDALSQALGVAKDIYGITVDMNQLESAKAKDALDAELKRQALKKGEQEMSPEYRAQLQKEKLDEIKEKARIEGDEARRTASHKAGISIPKGYERVTDPETGQERLVKIQAASVPGFAISNGEAPTRDDAKTLKELNEGRLAAKASLNQLRTLVDQYGTETMPGPVKDQMNRLMGDLKLKVKDVARLGQLTAGDFELLDSQIPETTGFGAMFTRNSTVKSNLKNLDKMLDEKVMASAKARGFVAKGEPTQKAPPGTGDDKQVAANKLVQEIPTSDEMNAARLELQKRKASAMNNFGKKQVP